MKVITRDLWLCSDCTQAAVNGDYTGLDYSLSEKEANARMEVIQRGLTSLGPHLVPDFSDELEMECCDCGFTAIDNDGNFPREVVYEVGDPADGDYDVETEPVCSECRSNNVRDRDPGEMEFSRIECDCCGSDLAGARFRFAQLGEED